MSSALLRGALGFVIPGGLIFAAMLVATREPRLAPWLGLLEGVYPYAVIGIALLLGWRFDRSRLVFATVIIAMSAWLLEHLGTRPDALGRVVFQAVELLLPLNLALVAVLKERGIFTWHGWLRWSLVLAQPLAVTLLIHLQRYDWLGLVETEFVRLQVLEAQRLPQPALLAFGLAFGVTAAQALRQNNAMESGLFWALALMLYALAVPHPAALTTTLFATAILILIFALLEISHFMAYRDELTGLPARRALNQALLKLGRRYTIAMLDVDHFKKFNDTYGHDVGDEVLKMVAARVGEVRGGGKPFRYGGEEFTVLFAGKSTEEALPHLERLRRAIAETPFTVRSRHRKRKNGARPPRVTAKAGTKRVTITISIGAAEPQAETREPQAVIKAADKALYRAKAAGRNRVST